MKHHFLLLRHCVRSKSSYINIGLEGFSGYAADYVADPLPNWQVPQDWCTPIGMNHVELNGAWLVDSGIISPGSHVEIISDTTNRDVDTAYALSQGIQDALEEGSNVSGLNLIHTESFMFHPEEHGTCPIDEKGSVETIQYRLDNLRRPDSSFNQALHILEEIAGSGKVGSLVHQFPDETTFVYDDWQLTGTPPFLATFGQMLFLSRAGLKTQDFASNATVEQVYKLLQYQYWTRSVVYVGNKWSATAGAAWANILLRVLSKGSLYNAPSPQVDSITIFTGHDTDLDTLSTALGVTWDLPEYQTHPEFVPTPPGSGLHVVRDTDTDEIRVSFVYTVYHTEGLEHWETDRSGTMKRAPVIWNNTDFFGSSDRLSPVPSFQDLELHILSTLGKYAGAMECYKATDKKFGRTLEPVVPESAIMRREPSPSNRHAWIPVVVASVITGFALALLICIAARRRAIRSVDDDTDRNNRPMDNGQSTGQLNTYANVRSDGEHA